MPKTKEQDQAFIKLYADFDRRKECTAEIYGALNVDFFDCKKLLVPGVTLHLRFFRSPNNTRLFLKGTDEDAKALDGKVQAVIEKASLFVRKVVLTDSVKLSIKKALVKSPAIHPNIESLSKASYFKLDKPVLWKIILLERSPSAELLSVWSKTCFFVVHP